jgi:hypothetical protein
VQSEPETIKNEEDSQVLAANRYRLLVFIANHTTPLYGTIRSYVARLGLAPGIDTASVELEVMQEIKVRLICHLSHLPYMLKFD